MGVLTRFKQIMSANINAILDKAENPEKMIDQYLRDLNKDLSEVKSETASVMADEKAAKRKLDECDEEISRMTSYAQRAVQDGNDEDAKRFLKKGNELNEQRAVLLANYNQCADASAKMRQMHDKLSADIDGLNAKKATLKAKLKVAETQEKLNKLGSGVSSAGDTMDAFSKMEDRIDKMLDKADAMSELNQSQEESSVESLMSKYDEKVKDDSLDDQLAALKASMGASAE